MVVLLKRPVRLNTSLLRTEHKIDHKAIAEKLKAMVAYTQNFQKYFLTKNYVSATLLLPKGNKPPSSRGLGHHPFTVVTAIRIRLGVPFKKEVF